MKEKYALLLSLKMMAYEINTLTDYSKECRECFVLLQDKLDDLCQFITSKDAIKQWNRWCQNPEIRIYCEQLRESSVRALCDMEKYQSVSTCKNKVNISDYIEKLTHSVRQELVNFGIDQNSKVVFVGSGAFPISAFTIAKEMGAQVLCVDIDSEAIALSKELAKVSGLDVNVTFTGEKLRELTLIKEATHVIVASLVKEKLEILEDLKECIGRKCKIVLRYGNGLKSVFNYPLEKDLSEEWTQTVISQSQNIYDTVILEKA